MTFIGDILENQTVYKLFKKKKTFESVINKLHGHFNSTASFDSETQHTI